MADHALATVTNPSSALTDFTLIVDLSDMPANWWSAVDTSDGTRGRVYKGDGSTRLACDWIDFDNTAETGLLRVLWSGTLASTGTQELWIEPPVSGNATVAASDTYGSDNAYDASWDGYWPGGGGTDRTSNNNDGTSAGGVTAEDSVGVIGSATSYDGTDDRTELPVGIFDSATDGTICAWFRTDSASTDQMVYCGGHYTNRLYLKLDGSGYLTASLGDNTAWTTGSPVSTASWYQAALYWSPNSQSLSIDAASPSNRSYSGSWGNNDADAIGAYEDRGSSNNQNFDGLLCEVHLHSTSRGADWISHEYDQTNDNSTFWGTWSWEAAGGGTTQELVGTLAGQGGVSAALEVERLLTGTASATGAVDAVLAVSRLLSAAVAGTAGSAGDLDVTRALSASTSGTGDLSGLLTVTRSLAAQADGVSTLSGAISVTRALAGTLAATGRADATLSVESVERLAGTLAGIGGTDAALTIRRALSGDLETTGDVAAALQVIRRLSGEIAGQAGASGSLQVGEIALAVGRVSVALEAKLPGAAFTSTTPSATFDVTAPGVTWEGN